jgi:hypothetical protein
MVLSFWYKALFSSIYSINNVQLSGSNLQAFLCKLSGSARRVWFVIYDYLSPSQVGDFNLLFGVIARDCATFFKITWL